MIIVEIVLCFRGSTIVGFWGEVGRSREGSEWVGSVLFRLCRGFSGVCFVNVSGYLYSRRLVEMFFICF